MGFFIGATIHDVAQVVGAGYSVSTDAGDLAVMVKLFRVAMLIPVVAAIAFVLADSASRQDSEGRLPRVGYPASRYSCWAFSHFLVPTQWA